MQLRGYKPTDKERVREICYATSTISGMERQLLCLLYCDYYVEREPQNCFILADDNDVAQGYILASSDYKAYARAYKADYLGRVKSLSRGAARTQRGEFFMNALLGARYPAHLHIDLMPEVQRGGWGTKLMSELTAWLKQNGVKGVQLGVGASNAKALAFYKKYGFKKLLSLFGQAVIMGLKLD